VRAALKIVADVLTFRLRRLEMANMAAAVAVMIALRLPLAELAVLGGFALILNVLAYLINDVVDVDQDLASGRAPEKTRFLAEHRRAALGAELALAAVLAAIALFWRPWLLVPAALGAGICWIYTAILKRVPYADIVAMALWGAAMPMVAIPPDSTLGWVLIGQLALFSACFELIQVLRDREPDLALGIQTTAVRLGPRRTLLVLRIAMLASAAYAIALLHRTIGIALLVAILIPLGADTERYWHRVRLVFGLVWLALVAWVATTGATSGALGALAGSATVESTQMKLDSSVTMPPRQGP
jgi:4-hydroxybenzoate polyprenyltransferase